MFIIKLQYSHWILLNFKCYSWLKISHCFNYNYMTQCQSSFNWKTLAGNRKIIINAICRYLRKCNIIIILFLYNTIQGKRTIYTQNANEMFRSNDIKNLRPPIIGWYIIIFYARYITFAIEPFLLLIYVLVRDELWIKRTRDLRSVVE